MTEWWRRYEGPALLVALVTAIFMAGASWLKLESVAARAADTESTVSVNGNRVTMLEAQNQAIKESLADIKQSLREIQNDIKTRH